MRPPVEFEIGGVNYRASRLAVKVQLNIARRLTPLITSLIEPMIVQIKIINDRRKAVAEATGGGGELPPLNLLDLDIKSLLPGLQSTAQFLADMPDEQFNYVQQSCMAVIERQRSGDTGWNKIWNERANQPQFDDIEGSTVLLIMAEVLKAELGPFMVELVSNMGGLSRV